MKTQIDKFNIQIECVCVDSAKIKRALLNDEVYNIEYIPSLLVFYDPGNKKIQHKVFTGKEMVTWFNDLLSNIHSLHTAATESTDVTVLDDGEHNSALIDGPSEHTITPLQGSLPLQGGEAAAMVRSAVGNDPLIRSGRKEIKTETLSAKELADQMSRQKEEYDKKIDEHKPFG